MNIPSLPPFVRTFLFLAAQGVAGAIVALNLAIPSTLSEAKAQGLIVIITAIRVVFGVATKTLPALFAYLSTSMNVETAVAPMEVFPDESSPSLAVDETPA